MVIQVSIEKVRQDISELVNQVANQGERVILTVRGLPIAVLVSVEDYERLQQAEQVTAGRSAWLEGAQTLAKQIRERRGDRDIDVDALLAAGLNELDTRHE